MENEIQKKITVITDRPKRWNNSIYDVITLLDMTNEFQHRDEIDNATIFEEENKRKQEETELEIKELDEKRKQLQNEKTTFMTTLMDIRNKLIEIKKNKKKDTNEEEKTKIEEKKKEADTKIKEIDTKIKEIEAEIDEKRKNKTETEKEITKLENEMLKNEIIKNDKEYNNIVDRLYRLKNKKKKEDEEKKKKEEEDDLKKYKSVRKNQINNIVIIDESITNTDIEMFTKISKTDFFDEIRDKYINKEAYSILVKPTSIQLDKPDWFKKGVFRFTKKTVYDIYSNKEDFELNVFFKTNKDVTEFRRKVNNILPGDNFEQKYQLYKEKKMNEANQKDVEIIKEYIHTVKEYETFITNRNKFATFLASGINNTNLNSKIQEASNHKYTKDILEKYKTYYEYTTSNPNRFPYTPDKPLNVYYAIQLHNNLTDDPAFENRKQEIANNIGIFANHMKGCIIESVSFKEIPLYDSIHVFKVDKNIYVMWVKAEPENSDIAKKFKGKKIYESHMKTMKYIMNNLKAKKNNGIHKGGSKTHRNKKISINKTKSKKI